MGSPAQTGLPLPSMQERAGIGESEQPADTRRFPMVRYCGTDSGRGARAGTGAAPVAPLVHVRIAQICVLGHGLAGFALSEVVGCQSRRAEAQHHLGSTQGQSRATDRMQRATMLHLAEKVSSDQSFHDVFHATMSPASWPE